jgi:DNA-directed RNA polymerase specialized sigma24 family protein
VIGQDEELARRVYAYFIFRLRRPEDAERLTQLSFERVWEEANLGRKPEGEPDPPVFAAARRVIAENPRPRGSSRVAASRGRLQGEDGRKVGLSDELALAIGRLHGRERDALALRFGAELSIGEIGELLDRTPAEVKQRLARGVRALISLGVLPEESQTRPSAPEGTGTGGAKKGKAEKGQAGDQGRGSA